jgi:hypothetical protein
LMFFDEVVLLTLSPQIGRRPGERRDPRASAFARRVTTGFSNS